MTQIFLFIITLILTNIPIGKSPNSNVQFVSPMVPYNDTMTLLRPHIMVQRLLPRGFDHLLQATERYDHIKKERKKSEGDVSGLINITCVSQ